MSDAGVAVAIESEVLEEVLDTAAEAKEGCPVGAIEEA
jgi:ferredoxin